MAVNSIETTGDLSSAPEFKAFLFAAAKHFSSDSTFTHIMKLDADVNLDPDYFLHLFSDSEVLGMSGGPLAQEDKGKHGD
jgi:hypothetical protein